MALPCALGSELIRYFATGGGKKMSSKPFSLGEKPAWSETSAQKCHLTQQLAHASPGVLRRPLPTSRSRRVPGFGGWRKRARALVLASSGRSLPPTGFTNPSCLRICLCPSAAAVHPGALERGFGGLGAGRWPRQRWRRAGMAAPSRASSRPPARSSRGEGRSHPVSCKYLSLFPLES